MARTRLGAALVLLVVAGGLTSCTSSAPAPLAGFAALDGTWVVTTTAAELQRRGVKDRDALDEWSGTTVLVPAGTGVVPTDAGIATLHLGNGTWSLRRPGGSSSGTYTLRDQQIVATWPGGGTMTATIGPNPEGGLVFRNPAEIGMHTAADRAWSATAFARTWTKG